MRHKYTDTKVAININSLQYILCNNYNLEKDRN
jgi:hypothetical protein